MVLGVLRGSLVHKKSILESHLLLQPPLPLLPTLVRYFDDFEDKYHTIKNPHDDIWRVQADGNKGLFKFELLPTQYVETFKHIAIDMFAGLDATSAISRMHQILRFPEPVIMAIQSSPQDFREYWNHNVYSWSYTIAVANKAAVHSLCRLGIGAWEQDLRNFVVLLPSPKQDIYKSVRQHECFIPLSHQALIIDYLDDLSAQVRAACTVGVATLRDACLMILSHQLGARPGQIARIRTEDVRTYSSETFHIGLPMGKQRGSEKMRLVIRRVRAEWALIFQAYIDASARKIISNNTPANLFFRLTPAAVSVAISTLAERLTGQYWTPTDFRHSAAQRLADAGTSHVSLSEFMGHTTTQVATVYFDASPAQAERINQALALSPIYANVATIAKTQFIDKVALLQLPQSHHIGGVPHGIPIAGIGGCSMGQSICTKNPVLSCYTCRKFLPLSDAEIHESVVASLQPVVMQFAQASRHNEESPAYTQLRRMLESASQVVTDIRSMHGVETKRPE
jgi:integrase